jgi:hypothetical protein
MICSSGSLIKGGSIMVSGISQSAGGSLQELLRSLQQGQEAMLEQSGFASATRASGLDSIFISTQAADASSNMMSGNFAGATEQSRYIAASLAGHHAEQQAALSFHRTLTAAAADILAANGIDASRCDTAAGAGMEMRRIRNTKTLEASGRNLDEIKENIEQKAHEAAAPKDENGNPVGGLPGGSAGEAAPMPEISGSALPLAPEAAAPPAPTPEAAATPEMATPAPASSTPSIDIRV